MGRKAKTAARVKETVRLRVKKLKGGGGSLYLEADEGGRRVYEFLRLYTVPELTPADKAMNAETMRLANAVKARRTLERQEGAHGFAGAGSDVPFTDYIAALAERRRRDDSQGNIGNWLSMLKHAEEYDRGRRTPLKKVDRRWVEGFKQHLEGAERFGGCATSFARTLAPNTRASYFNKMRAALRSALADGLIRSDPAAGVRGFAQTEAEREFLTLDELRAMASTPCEDDRTRRAFLFSCLTGLRRSDISRLTWDEVSEQDGFTRLTFRQKKTGGLEYMDINRQAADLMGERRLDGGPVFGEVKSPSSANHCIKAWALRAGVRKEITFHCARHTFAVLMLDIGTDIYTVSKLLGHRELATTQIYAKVLDKNKQRAVDSIPDIGGLADDGGKG